MILVEKLSPHSSEGCSNALYSLIPYFILNSSRNLPPCSFHHVDAMTDPC